MGASLSSGSSSVFTGDSGSGGTAGLVPAPAAGDAAANKFLKASGVWAAASSGLTVGTAVSGGGANRVLFEDASQNLAASSSFTFSAGTGTYGQNVLELGSFAGINANGTIVAIWNGTVFNHLTDIHNSIGGTQRLGTTGTTVNHFAEGFLAKASFGNTFGEAYAALTAPCRIVPSAAPGSPREGDLYFDSTTHKLRAYDGSAWQDCW